MPRIPGILLAALCVVAALGASPVHAEARFALVVGNDNYASFPPLANAANDARLLAGALEKNGYQVDMRIDADLAEMRGAIDGLMVNLKAAGAEATGLFYYAGHGVAARAGGNARNYLLPTDVKAAGSFDLADAISVDRMMVRMSGIENEFNLLLLDACRDYPEELGFSGVGLVQMNAPPRVMVQYATAPGMKAADGDGANSPYAKALAKNLGPGRVHDIVGAVRVDVERSTFGEQSPEERSGLGLGSFEVAKADGSWTLAEGKAGLSAGLAAAKRRAFLAAINRAIETAPDTASESRRYVKDFWVVRQEPSSDGSEYEVRLRALVGEPGKQDGDALERLLDLTGGPPKVLFILSERAEQDGFERPRSGGMQGDLWRVSAAEQHMAQAFRQAGYDAVATDDVIGTGFVDEDDLAKARQGIASFAARIGKAVEAHAVVVGTVRFEQRRVASIGGSDLGDVAVVNASVNAKTVVPSGGKVMASLSRRGFHRDLDGSFLMAREGALQKVAEATANELKWDLPFRLADEQLAILLEVDGVGYSKAGDVERFLGDLAGIESVRMEGWQRELSKYVLAAGHGGPRGYELAGALGRRFPGFRVTRAGLYEVRGAFGRPEAGGRSE